MKKLINFVFAICILINGAIANNLQISNLSFNDVNNTISCDVQWDNSWHDASGNFHDAIWIFFKFRTPGAQWKHANIQFSGTPPVDLTVNTSSDKKGAFIRRSAEGLGNISSATYKFDVLSSLGANPNFKVFGIEMVYIPSSSFSIGGVSSTGFYLHDPNDNTAGVLINSEAEIPTTAFTVTGNNGYSEDIPGPFPKGYGSFYCMKYKISQIQYAEFLNTLNTTQQNQRVASNVSVSSFNLFVMCDNPVPLSRNGIYFAGISDDGNYRFGCDRNNNGIINEADDGMEVSCNYLSQEDYLAYLDWAALRPPTRLEVWKICRGPELPVNSEWAWGTSINNEINPADIINSGTSTEVSTTTVIGPRFQFYPLRTGIFATSTSNRYYAGATYYGVMDMTIGMLESCVDIKSDNLDYTGNLGDGELNTIGDSDEIDFVLRCHYGNESINKFNSYISLIRTYNTTGGRGVR